ncbi:MAG TPA: glycosyltransferase family 1 protein, partial [Pyrinomonadaceae bacterium]|nr:glycosyltransferase family 1 protein [Pyrinomonadaceae bacterium]
MRIGLDGIPLGEVKTGVGHYTFELAQALARVSPEDQFELVSPFPFVAAHGDESEQALPPNLCLTRAEVGPLRRRRWWSIGLPLYLRGKAFSLFHGTNYDVPLWGRCPTVATVHDLSLVLYPETHEERLVRRARRRLPLMARFATAIITPSEAVKHETCEHLGVEPRKVRVVPEAPRRSFRPVPLAETIEVRRRLGVEDEFILFVGTIEPRKNLLTLARAFEEVIRATSLRPQLVIAGKEGWLTGELFSYLKSAGIRGRVRFTGYVSDDDLRALYSSCRAFVYPSLYEGFGLPPLEAMACGAAVITSRVPAITETVGEAARLVAPTDYRELAQAIIRLFEDAGERACLSSAGLARVARFSWEKTAASTVQVYREVLMSHAGDA